MDNSDKPDGNLGHALDLVFFEQWLRFYFLEERGDVLRLRVPDEVCRECLAEHPALFGLLEVLNNCEVDHQATLAVLGDNMLRGENALNGEAWAEVLCGADFRITMQLMSYWVQDEEDGLDSEVLSFREWKERFMNWRAAPAMRDYAARLRVRLSEEEESDLPARMQ